MKQFFLILGLVSVVCGWAPSVQQTPSHLLRMSSRARLYFGENNTGDFIDFDGDDSDDSSGCFTFKRVSRTIDGGYLHQPGIVLKSVDTFGGCIRLFQYPLCFGASLAIHTNVVKLVPGFQNASSVGPCVERELIENKDSETTTGFIKNPEIPDVLDLSGYELRNNATKTSCGINSYYQGYANRLEYFSARLSSSYNLVGSKDLPVPETVKAYFGGLEREDGDIMGYALPPEFKGQTSEAFNVLPMTKEADREWREVLERTMGILESGTTVQVYFLYETDIWTRPRGWLYRFYNQGLVNYGWISNAPKDQGAPETSDDLNDQAVGNSQARLFVKSDLNGDTFEDYNFTWTSCKDRYVSSDDEILTIQTFGSCVRLFEDSNCKGWSLAVYPGSSNPGNINLRSLSPLTPEAKTEASKLDHVFSLGPCFPQEFHDSYYEHGPNFIKSSHSSAPDLLNTEGDRKPGTVSLNCPLEDVTFDYQGRVIYFKATVTSPPQALQPSAPDEARLRDLQESLADKQEGDVLGFALPPSFGGPLESINVFPMKAEAYALWVRALEEKTRRGSGRSGKSVIFGSFLYPEFSSRPRALMYTFLQKSRNVGYGFISN